MKIFKKILLGLMVVIAFYVVITGKFSTFVELLISANDKFEYSNDYKINELQLESSDFYYNLLTDNQKKIYSAIAKGTKDLKKEVIVSKYNMTDINEASKDSKEAISAFLADHPEVFYMESEYVVSFTQSVLGKMLKLELNYSVDSTKKLDSKIKEIKLKIDEISNKVTSFNDYEKELYVHDYIAENVKYFSDYEDPEEISDIYHTAYSALVNKVAVCDGITKAYQLILGNLGIKSYIVTGYIDQTPHAWNLVNIEDDWLYVDITSDKYIKDDNGNTIVPVHTYFNVNTDFILNTHKIDKLDKLPEVKSVDYTYYAKNNAYIKVNENFENRVTQIVNDQKDKKILEFATDFELNVPEKLLRQLYNINFNNMKDLGNKVSMNYYNEQNVYIVVKK